MILYQHKIPGVHFCILIFNNIVQKRHLSRRWVPFPSKGGVCNRLCNNPEGPEPDTEQGPVRADQTTSDLFRSGGAGRRAAFLFGKGELGDHHGGAVHDFGDAAVFPVRHVREERAAAGGVSGPSDPEQIHPAEGAHLPDQQSLFRPGAAIPTGTGGEADCEKRQKNRQSVSSPVPSASRLNR